MKMQQPYLMEKHISHHLKHDLLLTGSREPSNLQEIAAMPAGQVYIETVHTHRKLLVTAQPRWVMIVPDLPFTGLPPEVFINASVGAKINIIELAVYTKQSNGEYFDDDFRAEPLARAAVEFLIASNPTIEGIAFEYIKGSDTYAVYEQAKKQLLASGLSEKQARKQAPKQVWDYITIAAPLHFTEIKQDVDEQIDSDSGLMHVTGVFYKK
jgi:hypothetical protein